MSGTSFIPRLEYLGYESYNMKGFEQYLKDNQQKLELEGDLNPEIWLSIENRVLKRKNKRNRLYIKLVSAAAVLLLGIIALSDIYQQANDSTKMLAQYGIDNERFTKQVANKTKILATAKIPINKQEDFDLLLNQLKFLDTQYQDYLQYIETNGFQPFIGQQILHYYKSKIDLLDKIQQEIEKINYYEKKYESTLPSVQLNI